MRDGVLGIFGHQMYLCNVDITGRLGPAMSIVQQVLERPLTHTISSVLLSGTRALC
jgi:hypothetical protein